MHRYKKGIIEAVLNGQEVIQDLSSGQVSAVTGEKIEGTDTTKYKYVTQTIKDRIAYFYPIVLAAATNGWTTQHNSQMSNNKNYINDALISGTMRLALVEDDGTYMPDTSLNFFTTTNDGIEENQSKEDREKLAAWYDMERNLISEKETALNLGTADLSTELESIKASIQSIESYIKDAITSVFDWGSG